MCVPRVEQSGDEKQWEGGRHGATGKKWAQDGFMEELYPLDGRLSGYVYVAEILVRFVGFRYR